MSSSYVHLANCDSPSGRSWTVQELRRKSWDDLHCLWWKCIKERNRLATERYERNRLKAGYGDYESGQREEVVRGNGIWSNAIRH
jgi:large subunit ribosomal protein L47